MAKKHEKLLIEACTRFARAQEFESTFRQNFKNDVKFVNGDSYNGWQWPDNIRLGRDDEERPCLTVNITRQHNLLIKNDMKRNSPIISVKPAGEFATYESAKMMRALLDYVQYNSNAQLAYENARSFAVDGGIGWWKIETDWVAPDSFEQDVYVRSVYNPLAVCSDPDAMLMDKSDGNWAFLYRMLPKEVYESEYPDYKSAVGRSPFPGFEVWLDEHHILVADYYRKVPKKDTLYKIDMGEGKSRNVLKSSIPAELMDGYMDLVLEERPTITKKVEQITIAGSTVIDGPVELIGEYIPLVPCIGEEIIIDGRLDRKGHTRSMLDPNRMYNYWASSAVEYGGLQTMAPFIGPAETWSEFEEYWRDANQQNFPYLPYRAKDEDGDELPAPERLPPPVASPVALEGMRIALEEMDRVSGQFTASKGETDNSRTGAAMFGRQSRSDLSTAHFMDNFVAALEHTGRIILSYVPHIYDTERVLRVTDADGSEFDLSLSPDPQKKQTAQVKLARDGAIAQHILNPAVGKYEVHVTSGDSFATRREQAFTTFALILTQAPDLVPLIGDLLMQAGDFPYADEAAQRLRRRVPKDILGEGPSQQEQMLSKQVQDLTSAIEEAMKAVSTEKLKNAALRADKKIDAFKVLSEAGVKTFEAFTERLRVIADAEKTQNLSIEQKTKMMQDAFLEALEFDIEHPEATNIAYLFDPSEGATNGQQQHAGPQVGPLGGGGNGPRMLR